MADNLLEKASILLTPTAYNDGSMLSVKPENGDGDFDFTRGSAATRVNAQGLVENVQIISSELVSNGDFSNGSTDWTLGSGWSIGDGYAVTDGTINKGINQEGILTSGKFYKISLDVNVLSGSLSSRLRFFDSNSSGTTISNITSSGTYTFYTSANKTGFQLISLSNNTAEYTATNFTVKEITDDTDIPRIDYTDGCGSWLLEPQSTNLYLNSDTLSTQSSATSASTYTVSFYGTGTITFSGTHTGTLVGTAADERVSATFTTTSGTLTSTISGTCTKGQLENQDYVTSYIPTNGSIATRLADEANNSGNSSLINSTEGVLYAEIAALANDGTFRLISISDGTNSNRIFLAFSNNNNKITANITSGGVSQGSIHYTSTNLLLFHKIALKYKLNDFQLWINGIKVATDTTATMPTGLNRLNFTNGDGVQNFFHGKAKALAVFPILTDAELQSLTTQ
jgi:hypothetical protein